MNKYINLIIILLLWLSSFPLRGQSDLAEIRGIIQDKAGRPLEGVHVELSNQVQGTTTNNQGQFFINNVRPGNYLLSISHIGYTTWKRAIQLVAGSNVFPPFKLEEDILVLNDISITATRTERSTQDLPIPITVIKGEQIRQIGSNRLNEVLQEQTGLAIIADHGTGVQIQGFAPDYTLLLIDGEPIIGRTAGTLELSRLTVNNIERIEIVKGPSSALYGSEAMGGVINIITKNPTQAFSSNLRNRYGSNNTWDLGADAHWQQKNLSLYLFGNYNHSDGFDLNPEQIGQSSSPYQNYTLQSKVSYDWNNTVTLSASGRFFRESQNYNYLPLGESQIVEGEASIQDWNFDPKLTFDLGNQAELIVHAYNSRYNSENKDIFTEDGSTFLESYFEQGFHRPEFQLNLDLNARNHWTLGGGYIYETVEASRYSSKQTRNSYYAFSQYEWNPQEKLALVFGLRYDHPDVYQNQVSPKVSAAYRFNDWLKLRASAGAGYKAPDFRTLYLNFTNFAAGYSVYGTEELQVIVDELVSSGVINPNTAGNDLDAVYNARTVKAESSWGYNIDLEIQPKPWLKANINFFRNDIQNLIDAYRLPIAERQIFSYRNFDKIFTQGIEAQLNAQVFPNLKVSLGYQYLDAKDKAILDEIEQGEVFLRDPQTLLSRQVNKSDYFGLINRSRHMGNAKVFYQIPQWGLNANLRVIYRGRYGFQDRNGNLILDPFDEYIHGYALWNLAISKNFKEMFSIQFGIDNLNNFKDTRIPSLAGRIIYGSLIFNWVSKDK